MYLFQTYYIYYTDFYLSTFSTLTPLTWHRESYVVRKIQPSNPKGFL